jgi:hypothetical protein
MGWHGTQTRAAFSQKIHFWALQSFTRKFRAEDSALSNYKELANFVSPLDNKLQNRRGEKCSGSKAETRI